MNSTTDRDPLDVVAEEFAARCRRGEVPSVGDYAARHPDLAADLRELLPAVAQMELLKRHRNSSIPTVMPYTADVPDKLGDYRLVRELGRGGMGVVYEAVQESLGRRVALKLLPLPMRNDAVRRERFLREAQVAAKLHHTNVVPVFGVGEGHGIPYFVMQFIPGCGLNDVIASWRTEDDAVEAAQPKALVGPNQWKRIAAVGVAAANALQYAHGQGVLHRDMKPGNLLLDHHGTVWVADFGLAKIANGETLTATGDLLGTIPYMAPEALRGQSDVRTDVYGLGMTLYELATGTMPFTETNAAILIRSITEDTPPPPRAVNPKVPRTLETIILKAIAREPHRRYASAGELADDLAAFARGEPIRARRTTLLHRGWLWARRKPIVASLVGVTAAALVFAGVVGWIAYSRASEALAKETRMLDETRQANRQLGDNLDLSLETFEKLFAAMGGDAFEPGGPPKDRPGGPGGDGPPRERGGPPPFGMRDGGPNRGPGGPGGPPFEPGNGPGGKGPPGTSADTVAMLETVLTFYEKFAEQNAADPRLQAETTRSLKFQLDAAKAYRKAGQLNLMLGHIDKAHVALRHSLATLDELMKQHPETADVSREVAQTVGMLPTLATTDPTFRDRYAILVRAAQDAKAGQPLPPGVYWKLAAMADAAGDKERAQEARSRTRGWRPPPSWSGGEQKRP